MNSQRQVVLCFVLLGLALIIGGIGVYLIWYQNGWWAIAWGWHWLFISIVLGGVTYVSIKRWQLESAFVCRNKDVARQVKYSEDC